MANIIPFSGNSQKAPQQERLTAHEAPLRKRIIDEVDVSVASLYPHAVRAHEAAAAALSNVRNIADHPRYEYVSAENDPTMAQIARKAIGQADNPLYQGTSDVQKAA